MANPIDQRDAEVKFKQAWRHADQARNQMVTDVTTIEALFVDPGNDNQPIGENSEWQSVKTSIRILYQHLGIVPPV